jgi:hypothetical protein
MNLLTFIPKINKWIKIGFDTMTALSLIGLIWTLNINNLKGAIICIALLSIFQISSLSMYMKINLAKPFNSMDNLFKGLLK